MKPPRNYSSSQSNPASWSSPSSTWLTKISVCVSSPFSRGEKISSGMFLLITLTIKSSCCAAAAFHHRGCWGLNCPKQEKHLQLSSFLRWTPWSSCVLYAGFNLSNKVPNFALILKSQAIIIFFLLNCGMFCKNDSFNCILVKFSQSPSFVLQMWARFIAFPQSII